MDRIGEEAFFIVMNHNDIWSQLKKWMFPNKKTSNINNYANGDLAAKYNYLSLLRERRDFIYTGACTEWFIHHHNLDAVKFLFFNKKVKFQLSDITFAVVVGNLEITKFLVKFTKIPLIDALSYFEENYRIPPTDYVCGLGNLELVKYIYFETDDEGDFTENAIVIAASKGHLEIVKFLYFAPAYVKNISNVIYSIIYLCELMDSQLDIFRFLIKNKDKKRERGRSLEIDENDIAAEIITSGNTRLLEILYGEFKFKKEQKVLELAIKLGKQTEVECLCKNGFSQYIPNVFSIAATLGHTNIVRYFLSQGPNYCTEDTFKEVIIGGHESIINLLYPLMNLSRVQIMVCYDIALLNNNLYAYNFISESSGVSHDFTNLIKEESKALVKTTTI